MAQRDLADRRPCLLDLPAELRNSIYEYALTADTAQLHLRSRGAKFLLAASKDRKRIYKVHNFNQLQNVSKQIRMETHALEAKFNVLNSNFRMFHALLQHVARYNPTRQDRFHWADHLRQIRLTGFTIDEIPAEDYLHGIMQFANTHGHVYVRVGVLLLCMDRGLKPFLKLASQIEESHREIAPPSFMVRYKAFTELWHQGESDDFLNPRVRFFPTGPFNDQRTRRFVGGVQGAYRQGLLASYGSQDDVVARIKAIYDDGI